MKFKAAIIDDHVGIREGFRAILKRIPYIDKVAAFPDFKSFQAEMKYEQYNLLFLDINLKNENGLEICKQLKNKEFAGKIVIISSFTDPSFILNAYHFEADGFIFKDAELNEIRLAVDTVTLNNNRYFNYESLSIILNSTHKNNGKSELTAIEMKVAIQICEGATTKETAKRLELGVATINSHRNRIWKKLDIHKTSELIAYMVSKGYFRPAGS
jgi:DNA-binding NarL/FixJ family response regulator